MQPVWLGWTLPHWDFAFAYGFYAPTGKYKTETVTFPRGGSITAEATDNIGTTFRVFSGEAPWGRRSA